MENITGYTCTTCGKVFETKEEFDNRHKKKKNKKDQSKNKD
jgi:DNA-directed RNA polymerase subunit RPC12/RpoP